MFRTHEATYLGEFVEERDGEKCIVKKWEEVTPLSVHNERIEKSRSALEARKIVESAPLGKVVVKE